jgi:hypothetical protein
MAKNVVEVFLNNDEDKTYALFEATLAGLLTISRLFVTNICYANRDLDDIVPLRIDFSIRKNGHYEASSHLSERARAVPYSGSRLFQPPSSSSSSLPAASHSKE